MKQRDAQNALQLQVTHHREDSLMSWNASFNTRAEFREDRPTFSSPAFAEIQASPETFHQYILGRQAAELLLSRPGVVPAGADREDGGQPTDTDEAMEFSVNLSGHANPGHQKTAGWANDCITVAVTQR